MKSGSECNALWSTMLVSKSGSVRTYETYNKGAAYPSCLVLKEESNDGGSTYNKMETPIYVYPSLSEESGIFINGKHFSDDVMGDEDTVSLSVSDTGH